jgi:superfamily II DNA helicase RecQ
MSELNALEFGILNERIKAQIEIYEKFSQAFERTMEMLRSHGMKIDDIQQDVMSDVIKPLIQLSHDVRLHSETARDRWTNLQSELQHSNESLQNSLSAILAERHLLPLAIETLQEMRTEMRQANATIFADLQKLASDQAKTALEVTKLVADEESRAADMASVPAQVASLHETKQLGMNKLKVVGISLAAAFAVLMAAEHLIQIGYLKLTWGGH